MPNNTAECPTMTYGDFFIVRRCSCRRASQSVVVKSDSDVIEGDARRLENGSWSSMAKQARRGHYGPSPLFPTRHLASPPSFAARAASFVQRADCPRRPLNDGARASKHSHATFCRRFGLRMVSTPRR